MAYGTGVTGGGGVVGTVVGAKVLAYTGFEAYSYALVAAAFIVVGFVALRYAYILRMRRERARAL